MRDPRAARLVRRDGIDRERASSFEKSFATRWSRAVREAYASPLACALDLAKKERTAELWFEGTCGPRGHVVALFWSRHKKIAEQFLLPSDFG